MNIYFESKEQERIRYERIRNAWKRNIKPPENPLNSRKSPRKVLFKNNTNINEAQQNISYIDNDTSNQMLNIYESEINNIGAYNLGTQGPVRKQLYNVCEKAIYNASEVKKRKSYSNMSGTSDGDKSKMKADSLLRQLQKERNTMAKLGFVEKAESLDYEIQALLKKAEEERKQEELDLYNEQFESLERKSKRRINLLKLDFQKELKNLIEKQDTQYLRLKKQQRIEFVKLIEDTQRRAIGKLKKCNCLNWYSCRHNKSASYNTRRPTPQVVTYKKNASRLKKKGQIDESLMWEDKALELDDIHQENWRKKISTSLSVSPWGPNVSKIDKLLETHKHNISVMKQTHLVEQDVLKQKQSRRMYVLQNIIASDKSKLKGSVHKQYIKVLEERIELEKLEETNRLITDDCLYGILDEGDEELFKKPQQQQNGDMSFNYVAGTNEYWDNMRERTEQNEKWVPPTKHGLQYSDRIVGCDSNDSNDGNDDNYNNDDNNSNIRKKNTETISNSITDKFISNHNKFQRPNTSNVGFQLPDTSINEFQRPSTSNVGNTNVKNTFEMNMNTHFTGYSMNNNF